MKHRVAVTGLGLISAIGNELEDFWSGLVRGKSGISEVSSFDTNAYNRHFAGEIKSFDARNELSEAEVEVYGRATQFAIAAASAALKNAGLNGDFTDLRRRIGVIMGTTFGEAQIVEGITQKVIGDGNGDRRFYLKQYNPNAISVNIAKHFGFCGPNMVIPTACAAGNYAISYAASLIEMGKADIMIAGGSDPFSHVSFSGFCRLGVMAETRCQPFDKNRMGMLVGEGAGVLVLEEYERARKRGARIYAEILGYGLSCDANHMTIPEVGGIVAVMEKALKNAGVRVKDINYISAHGTGTPINDKTESAAVRKVFYDRGNEVPISSIKSMLGHTMGAASALEAIASVLAIDRNEIPPTINYQTPDPECSIDCVPNHSRKKEVDVVLNNSFAFGGNNACVVIGRVK